MIKTNIDMEFNEIKLKDAYVVFLDNTKPDYEASKKAVLSKLEKNGLDVYVLDIKTDYNLARHFKVTHIPSVVYSENLVAKQTFSGKIENMDFDKQKRNSP